MVVLVFRRLASLAITFWLLSVLVFGATQILPGNAATVMLGPYSSKAAQQALTKELGLDRPAWVQYGTWLKGFVTGDWGTSISLGQESRTIVMTSLARSMYLGVLAVVCVVIVGIGLGLVAATRRGFLDQGISAVSYVGISVPEFVSGPVLLLIFTGGGLGLLPGSGYGDPKDGMISFVSHLVLPAAAVTLLLLAYVIRTTRTNVAVELSREYVRTARLKGVSEAGVVVRHVLRNALLPVITVITMNIGWLLGSVVVVEEVFAYPGIGRLTLFAVNNRDIPLLQDCVMVLGIATGIANLLADVLYRYANPVLRESS
ncbi:MAG: ABC transporter permease subunit [Streptosporangiales bacterium]|nr:ABC transporter permease subunit [Streptosporangiales bacterium]